MNIPPSYAITSEILMLLNKIEALRIYFSTISIPMNLKNKLERVSLLKSSLFSARIEGNTLTLTDVETTSDADKKKEIFNILKSIQYLRREIKPHSDLDKKVILTLHTHVLDGLSDETGYFRTEPGAIFNMSGVAVYISPPPQKIPGLLDQLFSFINSNMEQFPLVCAFVTHLIFEKIHPFVDGNGRVGRLLIYAILKSKGWDFPIAVSFEQYLDEHKDEYYFHLDKGLKNTNAYLTFCLEAFLTQSEKVKDEIQQELQADKKIFLPPRQDEIFQIIKDHKVVSFDFIKRRFLAVPSRTLRYDLEKLVKKNCIVKIGKTRGSYYTFK